MTRKKDHRYQYVAVDERGNLGQSRKHERYYTMVGNTVIDRESFEDIGRRYSEERGREVKYYDNPELREPIIREAARYVDSTYVTRYHKDREIHNVGDGLSKEEKVERHLNMLRGLAEAILDDSDYEYVDIEVDHNDLVKDSDVVEIFECSPSSDGRGVVCHVRDSKKAPGLITNDFIVGPVGDYYSDSNDPETRRLIRFLKEPKVVYTRDRNVKRRRLIVWRG